MCSVTANDCMGLFLGAHWPAKQPAVWSTHTNSESDFLFCQRHGDLVSSARSESGTEHDGHWHEEDLWWGAWHVPADSTAILPGRGSAPSFEVRCFSFSLMPNSCKWYQPIIFFLPVPPPLYIISSLFFFSKTLTSLKKFKIDQAKVCVCVCLSLSLKGFLGNY